MITKNDGEADLSYSTVYSATIFYKSPSYNNTSYTKVPYIPDTQKYCVILLVPHVSLGLSGERTQKHTSTQVYSRKGQHLSHASISGAQYRYITDL